MRPGRRPLVPRTRLLFAGTILCVSHVCVSHARHSRTNWMFFGAYRCCYYSCSKFSGTDCPTNQPRYGERAWDANAGIRLTFSLLSWPSWSKNVSSWVSWGFFFPTTWGISNESSYFHGLCYISWIFFPVLPVFFFFLQEKSRNQNFAAHNIIILIESSETTFCPKFPDFAVFGFILLWKSIVPWFVCLLRFLS